MSVNESDRQRQRAIDAVAAVNAGANPAAEAAALANEYTDRQTARVASWLRRVLFRGR